MIADDSARDAAAADGVPRVAVVAPTASLQLGGEAMLPLQLFRRLDGRGVDAHLVVHARSLPHLGSVPGPLRSRIPHVADTRTHRMLWRTGRRLPERVRTWTTTGATTLLTQRAQRQVLAGLVAAGDVTLIHQVSPVSPRAPSALTGLGVPVVIGPMNGGLPMPAAFPDRGSWLEHLLRPVGTALSELAPMVWRGKAEAAALLVANDRTRQALPRRSADTVLTMSEHGVDTSRFHPPAAPGDHGTCRFGFVGRLVGWKGVDLLVEAMAAVSRRSAVELWVIGDGPQRSALAEQVRRLGLDHVVRLLGHVPHDALPMVLRSLDCLVLPSLHESGGAVVLEAMATGLPVVATAWGGPTDYLDPRCGLLVDPSGGPARFVDRLAEAMAEMADHPHRRRRMGAAGRQRVLETHDADLHLDRLLQIYRAVLAQG